MIIKTTIPESEEECKSIRCKDCSLCYKNTFKKCTRIREDILQYYNKNKDDENHWFYEI